MPALAVLLFLTKHRGKALLKEEEADRHLLILLPPMVVRFFLRRLKEASLCAHAQINDWVLQMPSNSDRTVEAT